MSLPEWLFDDEEGTCEQCGNLLMIPGRLCGECKKDNIDLYADAAYQDSIEGK